MPVVCLDSLAFVKITGGKEVYLRKEFLRPLPGSRSYISKAASFYLKAALFYKGRPEMLS